MCRLEFLFQNLPFSKPAGKDVPFSCEKVAYPSHFLPFSSFTGIVLECSLYRLSQKKCNGSDWG